MAAPFLFVPEADPSTPYYPVSYHNPYYATPQAARTPVLPPAALLGTPNAFNPNSVLWPEDATQYESAYTASWIPLAPRPRTNSWAGPAQPPGSPFLTATNVPAFLQPKPWKPGHKKANSWSNTPAWVTNANQYLNAGGPQILPAPMLIHPFLNGDAPSPAFHFDLAPTAFLPMRQVSANPPSGALVSGTELREPAFHPPLFTLRIVHPRLSLWPVDLTLPPGAQAPPITLADVLVALHRSLHIRITHADWATLGGEDEARVTRAFAMRCRAEALRSGVPPVQLRDREIAVRNQGVLRVDFLQGKTVFKGLVRHPEGYVRLLTA
ncbi:hypothetical protein MVEN_01172400 [Mycena venus]|uniref:DUF6699 domain-containing protein n=1 Tax=Mycena venus TaxID=2733690 RepID=A0A8H6Y4K6_9AGAR|nr:hypothetical protein MVEN_01172400 [Mycena venus]